MLLLLSSANINLVPSPLTFTVLFAVSPSGVSLRCVKPSPVSLVEDTSISLAFSLPTVMTPPPVAGISCSDIELEAVVPNPTFPFWRILIASIWDSSVWLSAKIERESALAPLAPI